MRQESRIVRAVKALRITSCKVNTDEIARVASIYSLSVGDIETHLQEAARWDDEGIAEKWNNLLSGKTYRRRRVHRVYIRKPKRIYQRRTA